MSIESKTIQAPGSSMNKNYKIALIALAILYFMMGFITVLNDTLVPFFKQGFTLSYAQSSLVQLYFFLTYGLISIPAGKLVERIGFKNGMVVGFAVAALGALLFYPASQFHEYYLFLGALFIVAMGIVMLQVSANPYITILGSPETAASRLTFIQGIGSIGTSVAPVFGGYFILSKISSEDASQALVTPYLLIGATLLLIGAIVWVLKLPKVTFKKDIQATGKQSPFALLKAHSNLKFGAIALFMYVGAEVTIGTYLTNYIADRLHIEEHLANYYLVYYWGGMLVGRFLGAYFLSHFKTNRILSIVAAAAFVLILISILTGGFVSIWAMILVGLCNSIMFASIFSLSIKGLGEHTGSASGIMSTAIVGGAIITFCQGFARDYTSWSIAFLIPLLCYVYILYFGISGHKERDLVVEPES